MLGEQNGLKCCMLTIGKEFWIEIQYGNYWKSKRRTCTREVVQVIVPYDQCLQFLLYGNGEHGYRVQKIVAKVDPSQLCQVLIKQIMKHNSLNYKEMSKLLYMT